jgi:hypothetical protein
MLSAVPGDESMARSILLAGMTLAALSAAAPASAQVTEAQAGTIRTEVEASIGHVAARLTEAIRIAAPVAVSVAGDHYAVTVPPVVIVDRNTTFAGLEAIVTPTQEGWFTVEPTLSVPVLVPTAAGPAITLTLGKQSGTVTWAPAYRTDMAADLLFEGLALTTPDPASATLDRLGLTTVSTPRAPDHYDQTTVMTGDGLVIAEADGDWAVEHLEITIAGTDFDLPTYAAVSAAADPVSAGQDADAAAAELWAVMLDHPPVFDGWHGSFSARGLRRTEASGGLRFGGFTASMAVGGVTSTVSTLDLSIGWKDFSMSPPVPEWELGPANLTVDVALAGIPNAEVLAALKRLREASASMGAVDAFTVMAGELAPVLLLTDGLVLDLDVAGASTRWTLDLDASFHPEPASPLHVAGTGDITIGGIDALIAIFTARAGDKSVLQMLTALKMLGTEGTDTAGRPARIYRFVMGADGAMTLNGTDLGPLLQHL